MKARSLSLLTCTALAAAAAATAAEPRTYKVRFDDAWKVGDVVTRETKETEATHVVVKPQAGDQVYQDLKFASTTTWKTVEKCLAADGGKATKRLVYFVAWHTEGKGLEGAIDDGSLAATHVEVSRTAGAGAWKMLTPGKEVPAVAKTWLDGKFGGAKGVDADEVLSPKDPVAVGATWSADAALLAKAFNESLDVDPEKSSAKVTFLEVAPAKGTELGKFGQEFSLQTKAFVSPQGTWPWTGGGALTGKTTVRRDLAEGGFEGDSSTEFRLEGTAEVGPGVVLAFDYEGSAADAATRGGEMPPVPAAPASPAPAPSPAK